MYLCRLCASKFAPEGQSRLQLASFLLMSAGLSARSCVTSQPRALANPFNLTQFRLRKLLLNRFHWPRALQPPMRLPCQRHPVVERLVRNPLCMGIPRNSREMALFGQGIPMGIDQRRVDVSRTSSNVSCNEMCLSVGLSACSLSGCADVLF